MYNLFVSGSEEAWDGEPYMLELDRCVKEYTDEAIVERFGKFTADDVNALRRMPSIFAYETACGKDPRFGVIRNVTKRQGQARIEYELFPLDNFLTVDDLKERLAFDLDISKWEMNRTHWAVKDVDLARELGTKCIVLPNWARMARKTVDITKHEFAVAFSFPGEVREYVEQVAAELEHYLGPNSYFYDNNYESQLARPSLDTLLQEIYRNRSRLVVVFLSSDYERKEWCGVEFHAIREVIMERQNERVMFVRMDDGEVEGVFNTDGYVDGRKRKANEVARLISERVELAKSN